MPDDTTGPCPVRGRQVAKAMAAPRCQRDQGKLRHLPHTSSTRSRSLLVPLMLALLFSHAEARPMRRRKFSVWMDNIPGYDEYEGDSSVEGHTRIVTQGLLEAESIYYFTDHYFSSPIHHSQSDITFHWNSTSDNVRYEIIVSSEFPHFMPEPAVIGVSMSGVLPRKTQDFKVHFPCHKGVHNRVLGFAVEFRFFKGKNRKVPLYDPGLVHLRMRRSCPRVAYLPQIVHKPQCRTICGLRSRQGRELREKVCQANYVIRASVTSQYNSFDPDAGLMVTVDKQYRRLKAGVQDNKVLFPEGVTMSVSYNVSDCQCLEQLKTGQRYLIFASLRYGRPLFTESSLVAQFDSKARRVVKRLHETKSVCDSTEREFIPFDELE